MYYFKYENKLWNEDKMFLIYIYYMSCSLYIICNYIQIYILSICVFEYVFGVVYWGGGGGFYIIFK